MSSTSSNVVFVTGGNGFVGSATVLELIKRGYKVKGSIRSQAKADAFNKMYPTESKSIERVVVPDLMDEQRMTSALSGVDYVIHMASPFHMNFTNNVEEMLKPARELTLYSRIKRVVLTSSFVAVWDLMKGNGLWPEHTYTAEDWNPATWEQAAGAAHPLFVYSASKSLAEKAAFDFVEKEKPGFSITTFCPPFIWGPPGQPDLTLGNLNTSTWVLWWTLSGQAKEIDETGLPVFVDVRDLAYLQVAALTNDKAKNQRYLAISDEWYMEQLVNIVKEEFPHQAYRLPPTVRTRGPDHFGYDVAKTERVFDIELIPLRKTVVETMKFLFDKESVEKAGEA
ncbi:NADP-binding protein [Dacryopinax primogenitus]|uniref:NADP-binding protein n=1 Tax=Dacryopinax primogenitus (strain DJM 731) TaxID=1858805 RepID=M5GF24_DACPD|nr:NADP-binding protein [Dacryopinax primogenitus]EJU03768.1 NADP-binding protein [Dacryopinax primogenitus]